jgi:hypothetical protein
MVLGSPIRLNDSRGPRNAGTRREERRGKSRCLHVFSLAIHFELFGDLCAGEVTGYDIGQGP